MPPLADRSLPSGPTRAKPASSTSRCLSGSGRACRRSSTSRPVGPQWVHEIKWDGYRVSAYVADGVATIRTRNGHDWTKRFPAIARAAAALQVRSAVIDGEAVILDERGPLELCRAAGRPRPPRVRARRALRLRPAVPRRRAVVEEAA